jgi:DNA-directed RNA polymerase subunit RPC12/RpoP
MNSKQLAFIKSMVGDDFLETLGKSELYKPDTKTTIDPLEIKAALNIVPRILLSFLISELKPMKAKEFKDIHIPWAPGVLHVEKHGPDVYSGQIMSAENRVIYEFKFRSLPSVGLVILTTFELYDLEEPKEESAPEAIVTTLPSQPESKPLQDIIDERLKLHGIIREVIDQRLSEREAIQQLLLMRLKPIVEESEEQIHSERTMDRKLKLKEFIENRKLQPIDMDKKEDIRCPDCSSKIFKSGESVIKCCICYGSSHNKEIKFKKSENGVKFDFPKDFDAEDISMLIDAIKDKK